MIMTHDHNHGDHGYISPNFPGHNPSMFADSLPASIPFLLVKFYLKVEQILVLVVTSRFWLLKPPFVSLLVVETAAHFAVWQSDRSGFCGFCRCCDPGHTVGSRPLGHFFLCISNVQTIHMLDHACGTCMSTFRHVTESNNSCILLYDYFYDHYYIYICKICCIWKVQTCDKA